MELSMNMNLEGHQSGPFQSLRNYLRAIKEGKVAPPYLPKWEMMPVHHLALLASYWFDLGWKKEGQELKSWLAPLTAFPTLWCPEKEYHELEIQTAFQALEKIFPIPHPLPPISVELFQTPFLSGASTLDGNGSTLGVIRSAEVEIRAFGPQNRSLQFGISGRSMDGWTRTSPYPEIWLEMKKGVEDRQIRFDFRFVGIHPESPLSLAFYVKGKTCQIGKEIFKPKSLRRYQGEMEENGKVLFDGKLALQAQQPHKVELIPLAGEGCYWNCDFLLSYELSPFISTISFLICAV